MAEPALECLGWPEYVDVPISEPALEFLRESSKQNLKAAKKNGTLPQLYDIHVNRLIAYIDRLKKQ